jgi:hypothetical protein
MNPGTAASSNNPSRERIIRDRPPDLPAPAEMRSQIGVQRKDPQTNRQGHQENMIGVILTLAGVLITLIFSKKQGLPLSRSCLWGVGSMVTSGPAAVQ